MNGCRAALNLLIMSLQAEKEAAELRRDVKALEALVEAKANFMDAFDQLQNLPLVDGKYCRSLSSFLTSMKLII